MQVKRALVGSGLGALLLASLAPAALADDRTPAGYDMLSQIDGGQLFSQAGTPWSQCVTAGLQAAGITSRQMLLDLLESGPRTRDAVEVQMQTLGAACAGGTA